jgi:hypothetical protein
MKLPEVVVEEDVNVNEAGINNTSNVLDEEVVKAVRTGVTVKDVSGRYDML